MNISKAQRFSKQRELILNIIQNTNTHPNADWIYHQAKIVMPNISLGTIYRNLSQLEKSKQIKILHNQTQLRYDGNMNPHDHFFCKKCEQILDLMTLNQEIQKIISQNINLDFDTYSLELKGICPSCNSKC